MKNLYDIEIRKALINRLKKKSKKVIEELHIHNGNAIADVVSLNNEAHCYEIKSDVDNINRIKKQGYFYDLSFSKITLVTTKKHLQNALKIAPLHWGIMVADYELNEVRIKYIRGTKYNKLFNKAISLKILWKEEMLSLGYTKNKLKRKDELVHLISEDTKRKDILKEISNLLSVRYENKLKSTS